VDFKIVDEKNYKYAGRCRQCGFYCEWIGGHKKTTDYQGFYERIRDNYFPSFLADCENCDNEAVFDLTALTRQEIMV
jgi:hypothetical protein